MTLHTSTCSGSYPTTAFQRRCARRVDQRIGHGRAYHSKIRMEAGSEGLINSISVAVTNFSPANAVKKGIARLQAGAYDEGAVTAKLDSYIQENPVVVFSWTRRAVLFWAVHLRTVCFVNHAQHLHMHCRCPFCTKAKNELTAVMLRTLHVCFVGAPSAPRRRMS